MLISLNVICFLFHDFGFDSFCFSFVIFMLFVLVIDFRSLLRLFSAYVDSPFQLPRAKKKKCFSL